MNGPFGKGWYNNFIAEERKISSDGYQYAFG